MAFTRHCCLVTTHCHEPTRSSACRAPRRGIPPVSGSAPRPACLFRLGGLVKNRAATDVFPGKSTGRRAMRRKRDLPCHRSPEAIFCRRMSSGLARANVPRDCGCGRTQPTAVDPREPNARPRMRNREQARGRRARLCFGTRIGRIGGNAARPTALRPGGITTMGILRIGGTATLARAGFFHESGLQ